MRNGSIYGSWREKRGKPVSPGSATDPNCHLTWMSVRGVKGTGGRMTTSLIICIETSLSGFQCNLSHTSAFTVNLL